MEPPLPQYRGTPRFGAYHIKKGYAVLTYPFRISVYPGLGYTVGFIEVYGGLAYTVLAEGVAFRYTPVKGVIICAALI